MPGMELLMIAKEQRTLGGLAAGTSWGLLSMRDRVDHKEWVSTNNGLVASIDPRE